MGREIPLQAEPVRTQPVKGSESKSLLFSFLELVCARWMIVGGIFFSGVFWSYFTLARSPEVYGSVVQVLIRRGKLQAVQDVPILRQQEEIGSEVDILTSVPVLHEVVRQILEEAQPPESTEFPAHEMIFDTYAASRPRHGLTVADLPTTDAALLFKYLRNRFRIQKFGESNVIQVSLESPSAVFSAEAVNTLVEVYEKFNLTVEQSPGQSQYFADEIDKVDEEIDTLQSALAQYKSSNLVVDIEKQQELQALRRHSLVSELDELQVDKAALETDLETLRHPSEDRMPAFLRTDEMLMKMRADLILRVGELAQLRSKLTEENPLVVSKREEVSTLQRKLEQEEQSAIAQQHHLYQQICDRETELRKKIAETDTNLRSYPYVAAKIDRYDRDIKQRTTKRADMVERMFKSTTLESPDETMNKVKVIGYAPVPVLPLETRKGFKFLVAALFSLILAFLVAGFVENLDHTIRKREQLEEHLGLPHLASISIHYV